MGGWSEVTIGYVCKVIAGQSPDGTNYNDTGDGLPFYQGKKQFEEKYIGAPKKWTTQITREAYAGDILMSVRAPVGPINFATRHSCIGRGLAAIRTGEQIQREFLFYVLLSMQNQIKGNEGAVFSSINKRQIESISIPLPPLPKQERIVAILDEASAAIATATANAEKNLANARELFESACASIFSNAENEDWTSTTVEAVAKDKKGTMRTGPFGSQLLHSEFVEEGVVVLGIDNAVQNEFAWDQRRFITEEKFAELSRFEAFPGDVVITIMGTCGRCAVLPEHLPRAITSKHLCCITTDKSKCLPEYLHHYFLHHPLSLDYLEKNAKGAIMAGLNMTIIKGLPIKFPSIEEQVELVRRFDSMSNHYKLLKKVLKAKQECYTELRQSILHKAFTGELTADKKAADRTLVEAGL